MKASITELEACNIAAQMVRAAGFEFRYSSLKSEACYYGLPGRLELLRIAAHSHDNGVNGLGKIVSRLTLNSQNIKFRAPDTMDSIVAHAIGHYMLRSAQVTSWKEYKTFSIESTRDNMCLRKTVYETKWDAQKVASHMRKIPAHEYFCAFCGHWHVGSNLGAKK